VVFRTLSKIGLAGLRVGFIIADREIIEEVNKVRLPFNLNTLSQKIAIQALRDGKKIERAVRTIVNEREELYSKLMQMKGITPYPSQANFILFKTDYPKKIYRGLLKQGILIRDMSSTLKGCLRVTVGKPSENRRFIKTLKGLL
jgi:histidinol-phosphate aminotransferase